MGMASFVDRLRDFLNDAMHFRGEWFARRAALATTEVTEPPPPQVEMRAFADDLQRRIDAYGPLLDSMIQQLNHLLEYATDPQLHLVEEVHRLRIARVSYSAQLTHACRERNAARAEITHVRDLVQQAHYEKRTAEAVVVELREKLAAREAAHEHDVKSLKGELAVQRRMHERKIEELQTQHNAKMVELGKAHHIAMNDLRKRAELTCGRPIKSNDQIRQEEFAELLPAHSSPTKR